MHAALDRHGLASRARKRPRPRLEGTPLSRPLQPNDLWCADYKGEFMLADRRYCYPLTITDFASRYLLCCEGLSSTQELFAFTVFKRVFQQIGLPRAIRTDNGVPFASARAVRTEHAIRVVASAGHRHRAHPPRPGMRTITVTNCGRICLGARRKINLSTVLAGQNVGIKQVDEHVWLLTFMQYDLGFFDDETCRLEPGQNPFEAVLPMSPV